MWVNDRRTGRKFDATAKTDAVERRKRHRQRLSGAETHDFAEDAALILGKDFAPGTNRYLARHPAELNQHSIDSGNPAITPVFRNILNIFNELSEKRHTRPQFRDYQSGKFPIDRSMTDYA